MDGLLLAPETRPLSYSIRLAVDVSNFTYVGEETIMIHTGVETPSIRLHADEILTIESMTLDQHTLLISHKPWQILEGLGFPCTVGDHTLTIKFRGSIEWGTKGFIACQRGMNFLAYTHFEPIYARTALPCFDEPQFKSKFTLSVEVSEDYEVLSNTPIARRDGRVVEFQPTPLMSVYLLHWTVCKLSHVSKDSRGHTVSIHSLEMQSAEEKCELARGALEFLEDYFDYPYVLPKLDLISVHRMKVRAMENWGAITFLYYILENQPEMTLNELVRNNRTICHEISHMWFGNLVTMKWWDDLWLNEGYARFIEHKVLHSLHPEYQLGTLFLKDVFEIMIGRDRPPNTHPVILPCIDPEDIDSIFDVISYAKGASLARMLEHLMGDEQFRLGIRAYIKRFEYQNATTEDLWSVLDGFADSEVSQIMREWTHLNGHPDLFIEQDGTSVIFSQVGCTGGDTIWPIPLFYRTSTGISGKVIMKSQRMTLEIGVVEWVKVNVNHTVPMQTLYPSEMLVHMAEDFAQLSAEDIYGLVLDCFYFFKRGKLMFATLETVLEAAAKHVKDVSLVRKLCEIFKYCEEEMEANTFFKERFRHFALRVAQHYQAIPESDFYHDEIKAFYDTSAALYGEDRDAITRILKEVGTAVRPEVLVLWARVIGLHGTVGTLELLKGDQLEIALMHAGPEIVRHCLRAGELRRLRRHNRLGQVLVQATEAVLEQLQTTQTCAFLTEWGENFSEFVRYTTGSAEFCALKEKVEAVTKFVPQCGQLQVMIEEMRESVRSREAEVLRALNQVGITP